MGIRFEFFEAGCGDSILVSTSGGTHILIDGGISSTYEDEISYQLSELDKLDLVVVTHIDNDHICGVMELLNDQYNRLKIKKLWFNMASEELTFMANHNNEIGQGQGDLFTHFINQYKIPHKNNIYLDEHEANNIFLIALDIELILLSPNKEHLDNLRNMWKNNDVLRDCNGRKVEIGGGQRSIDRRDIKVLFDNENKIKFGIETSETNKSSIAFIVKYKDKNFLFLGDADIRVINERLQQLGYSKKNKLNVEFVKLSHHGSKKNINREFLDLIKTNTFVTLTNGTYPSRSKYKHPDKETYALILNHEDRAEHINLYFNYNQPIDKKFVREMREESIYKFRVDVKNRLEFFI